MKKILLFNLLIAFSIVLFAQNYAVNSQNTPNGVNVLTPQMKQQVEIFKQQSFQNSQLLIPQTFTIDYEWYDSQNFDYYTSFIWQLHEEYTQNDLLITDDGYGTIDTLFWKYNQAGVAFNTFNDSYAVDAGGYPDSITYDKSNATTTIDSIFYSYSHTNNSGMMQEVVTQILPLNADGSVNFNATPLWEDVLASDTSLTEEGYLGVRAIAAGVTLPNVGDGFGISVNIRGGDRFVDEFFLLGGYGSPCNEDDPELATFTPNSYFNLQISSEFGLNNLNGLQDNENLYIDLDGSGGPTPGGCERIFIQNWSIWAQVTVDAPFSVNSSIEDEIICPGDFTVMSAFPSFGTPDYTYSWSPTAGLSSPQSASTGVSVTETSTFTVTVTDATGATVTSDVTVTVDELSVNVGDDQAVDCGMAASVVAQIISPNSNAYTFEWSNVNDQVCCGDQSDLGNLFIDLIPGSYTLTVNDGLCEITDEIEITLANSNLTASFEHMGIQLLEVEFTSTSIDAGAVFWDFGDGSVGQPNSGPVVIHTFTVPGTYPVTITTIDVNNNSCNATATQNVTVFTLPLDINEADFVNNLSIHPVPASDRLFIELESITREDVAIELFNAQGQSLISQNAENGVFNGSIDVSSLSNGIYYVAFKFEDEYLTKKITINK